MKTIARTLFAIIIALFAFACEDHDYFVIEEQDGKDGYSIVTRTISVTDGTLVEFFLDTDYSRTYTPTDDFQNSFTVLNGLNGANGNDGKDADIKTKIIQDGTCGGPALVIETFSGGELTSTQTICLPKDGADGQDGYNPVQLIEPWCEDGRTGRKVTYYLDKDRSGTVTPGDELMGGYVNLDGIDGNDGADGQDGKDAPVITATFNLIASSSCESGKSVVFSTFTNGVLTSSVSVCVPRDGIDGNDGADGQDGVDGTDGKDGMPVSIKTVRYDDIPGCVEGSGMVIYWYLDLNMNGAMDGGDRLLSSNFLLDGEDGANGIDGQDGLWVSFESYNYGEGDSAKIHRFYYDLDFSKDYEFGKDSLLAEYVVQLIPFFENDGTGSSNYAIFYNFNNMSNAKMEAEGAEFKNLAVSSDRLHGFYNGAKEGYFITPQLPPYDNAYRFEYMYALKMACKLEVYGYYDGKWNLISGMITGPTSNFKENDLDTYLYTATWWKNSDMPHIERFMIKVTDQSVGAGLKCTVNEYVNIDNVRILLDDPTGSSYQQPGN